MTQLEIRCLGPFQALLNGERLTDFRSEKERALLAYLAIHADRRHRREALATLLWPSDSRSEGRRNLRLTLHRLRNHLSPEAADSRYLHATRDHLQLNASLVQTDVGQFEALVKPCGDPACLETGICDSCVQDLRQAIEIYRGRFLQGFALTEARPYMEWLTAVRERFQRVAISSIQRLCEFERRHGRIEAARALAERQLELQPWNEEAHRTLIGLLARAGERSAALAQYQACKRALERHLNVGPSPTTDRLVVRIRSFDPSVRPPLPQPTSPLFGRLEFLERASGTLAKPDVRLLTITGPGGVGKTRAAIALARRVGRAYLDGVIFVSLTGVARRTTWLEALAGALGLDPGNKSEPLHSLLSHLRDHELLLVLDSFDDLLASTDVLASLLSEAQAVDVLVTSRAPLQLKQERVLPLAGLETSKPSRRAPAAEMFEWHVRRRLPDWQPDPNDRTAIDRIITHLAGHPLGIELAAASYPDRSLESIDAAIQAAPDRLAPLAGGPNRHRSIRAVFEHACRHLRAEHRQHLLALSVIQGNFGIEAAQAIADAGPPTLAALSRASLLERIDGDAFRFHDVLHSLARQDLQGLPTQEATALSNHEGHFLRLLARSLPRLRGPDQQAAIAVLDRAWQDLQLAWQHAVHSRHEGLVEPAALPLARYCVLSGRTGSGEQLLRAAISAGGWLSGQARATMKIARAELLIHLSDFERADRLLQQAMPAAAPRHRPLAMALQSKAAARRSQHRRALSLATEAADLFEELDNRWGLALAYHERAGALWEHAAPAQALQAERRAHQAAVAAGAPRLTLITQNNLAAHHRKLGHYQRARELIEPLVDHPSDPRRGYGWPLINMGLLDFVEGDYDAAGTWFRQAIRIGSARGGRHVTARARYCLADALLARGDLKAAEGEIKRAIEMLGEIGDQAGLSAAEIVRGEIAEARGDLEAADSAYRRAAAMSKASESPFGRVAATVRRGLLAKADGHPDHAAELLARGIRLSQELGPASVHLLALAGAADLLRREARLTSAGAWLSALSAVPDLPANVRDEIQGWGAVASVQPATDAPTAPTLKQLQVQILEGLAVAFPEAVGAD